MTKDERKRMTDDELQKEIHSLGLELPSVETTIGGESGSTSLHELRLWFTGAKREEGESVACDAEEIIIDGKVVGISIEPVDGLGCIGFFPK